MECVTIGNATLWLGDCLELLPLLSGVDAVITDPPYGIGYSHGPVQTGKWKSKHGRQKVTGDDRPFDPRPFLGVAPKVIMWGANNYAQRLPESGSWMIWDKRQGIEDVKFSMSEAEIAWANFGGAIRMFRHLWFGLARASEVGSHLHPTQKPIALMKWCIQQAGVPKKVFDPYMGSGTTGVACMDMGCEFVGCEIEREHFDVACRRIESAQQQMKLAL